MAPLDVTIAGLICNRMAHFEGHNILELVAGLDQRVALADARQRLFGGRERRVYPGRDEKVLTSWNGMVASTTPATITRR